MNNHAAHSKLVDDILFAIGALPDVRLWQRRVGLATPVKFVEGKCVPIGKPIYFGIKGESDLQGIIRIRKMKFGSQVVQLTRPLGLMLAIEVKTGKGELTEEQEKWKKMIESFGGIFIEARSVEETLNAVLALLE